MNKVTKFAGIAAAAAMMIGASSQVAKAEGYGTAGCGLGAIIFGDKPGFIQVLAATFNATSGSQTFGISSGTSRCGKSEPSATAAAAFIETNREAFAKDAARGNGETISSLATLAGCQNPGAVGNVLQTEFTSIFPSAEATDQQISNNALETLKSHAELACSNLI